MVSIKLEIPSTKGKDVRRFRMEDLPEASDSFAALNLFLSSSLPSLSYTIKYKDDEGDLVTIASDSELKEALRLSEPGKCPRLYLVPVSQTKKEKSESDEVQVSGENKSTYSIEVQFQDKSETTTIPKTGITLLQLKEKVASMFSLPKEFILKYLDDEGDAVTMTEQEELNDALQLAQEGQVLVIVAVPTSSNSERTQSTLPKEEEKEIGRAVQQECRDRSRMPSSA
eukprot:TRINITY_DN1102_c0_g1_i16.p1 TRINITY_DN1102_c0_g1~~TRINITY_DN1102_c0_g1_i16.p1  ORF type:complete len:227 (-),score=53.66 TRINITY_DN1102_c0_g1_i16:21-701(-)